MEQPLTSKQTFWRDHIVAAQRDQLTYAEYAKQHGLNLSAFYNWSMTLRRKGLLGQTEPAFVELKVDRSSPVRSSAPIAAVQVRLANGIELELPTLTEQSLRWLAAL